MRLGQWFFQEYEPVKIIIHKQPIPQGRHNPQAAAGKRIEPPVSLPSEPKQSPAAVATPEPLEEAPAHLSGSQGFTGASKSGW